ncbi:MAG: protein BatD [Ignavibacteriales bacterium]|nr:MAG: protein BatD [Ignavibacteriales bacterium]
MLQQTVKIFFLILVISFSSIAQSFEASVNNTKVGAGDRFQVSFTFSGEDINSLKNFSPPDFSGFMVLSGPNQSTSMQIINGAVSASKTLSYILQPKSEGNFTIESASIDFKGSILKTKPIKIEVAKGTVKQDNSSNKSSVSNEEIAKNLFIRATIDKSRAYVGEQVTVVYKLYTRLNIAAQMSVSKIPQYRGFWAEELETSNNLSYSIEVLDGRQFRVAVLKRVALFPSQSGELSVTPFQLTVPVQIQKERRSNNIFDDFFSDPFGRNEIVNVEVKSNTLNVKVNPLPEDGKPESFNGAVGNFTLNAKLDKQETKANEPVALKISIAGTGNISLIELNELNLPPGIEKYDPQSDEQINRSAKVGGKKNLEYLLVPRAVGKKEIPAIEFSFFNPSDEKYVTLSAGGFNLNVLEGEGGEIYTSTSKEGIKMLGRDIRFIKTDTGSISKGSGILLHQTGFLLAVFFPMIIAVGAISWKVRKDKLSGDVRRLKFVQAEKIAKSRLKNAKKLLETKQQQSFYNEISQALFGYLEDKLQIPKSEFTLERAVEELELKKLNPELINDMKTSIEKCEYVRFAPRSNGQAEMNEMYSRLSNVIIGIEKTLSSK